MRFCLLLVLATLHFATSGSYIDPPKDTLITFGHYQVNPLLHSASLFILPGDETGNGRSVSLPQLLTGKIPGLFVLPSSFQAGNESYLFLVRGTNSFGYSNPLFIVDGVPNRDITAIDADDIESISLLKDGTASLYGSRGANGVLFINTKKGNPGKPRLTLKLNQGFNQPTIVPDMADAATYATMQNETWEFADIYSDDEIQKFRDGSDPLKYPNTDWFNSVYKKVSLQNSIYTSLKGGMKHFNYFVSAGTKYQDGIFKNSASNSRLNNFRANLEGRISFVSLRVNLNYQQKLCNAPTRSTDEVFSSIFEAKPTMVDFWPGNKPGPAAENGNNPVLITTDASGTNKKTSNNFQNSALLSIEVPFISGLKLNALYSYDQNRIQQTIDIKPWLLYNWDGGSYDTQGNPILTSGSYSSDRPHTSNKNLANMKTLITDFSYRKNFSQLSALLSGGFEKQNQDYNNTYNYWSYNDSEIDSSRMFSSESGSNSQTVNYFASLNLKIFQRFLLETTVSLPKSDVLPEKNRSKLFASASFGWVISDELFWTERFGFISFFKIHGSWGKTGTDNAEILSGGFNTGLPNPDLIWETSAQSTMGFEGQLFNGVLAFEFDVFSNHRQHILMGDFDAYKNLGEMRNKGFDYLFSFTKSLERFAVQISLTGSYAKNKILEYNEVPGAPSYQRTTGKPFTSFYTSFYEADGIFHNEDEITSYPYIPWARPGDIRFRDVNKDSVINGLDRVGTEKDIIPRFQGGMNVSLRYGQFDLSIFIQGAAGGQVYIWPQDFFDANYFSEFADNRWTPENTHSDYPRAINNDAYWTSMANTFWLRPTDYIRLKNAEIGYSMSGKILHSLKMQQFRVYLRGFNLVTLDKVKLIDPEVPYSGNLYYRYPTLRYFDVGLSCSF
jgi:TonB-linked SusC/RagA family outer membrane protein